MVEANHRGLSAHLRRLPGQLLLALINATVIFTILAATLALVTISRIEHFAGNMPPSEYWRCWNWLKKGASSPQSTEAYE
jgi:hypothetical protein